MNLMSDQIADLPEEEQQQFHAEAQRHLRREWAEAQNRTEKETDDEQTRTRS